MIAHSQWKWSNLLCQQTKLVKCGRKVPKDFASCHNCWICGCLVHDQIIDANNVYCIKIHSASQIDTDIISLKAAYFSDTSVLHVNNVTTKVVCEISEVKISLFYDQRFQF